MEYGVNRTPHLPTDESERLMCVEIPETSFIGGNQCEVEFFGRCVLLKERAQKYAVALATSDCQVADLEDFSVMLPSPDC